MELAGRGHWGPKVARKSSEVLPVTGDSVVRKYCGLSKYQRVFLNSSVLPEQKGAVRERGTVVKIMGEEHSMFSFSWKHKLPTHQFSYLRLTKICS